MLLLRIFVIMQHNSKILCEILYFLMTLLVICSGKRTTIRLTNFGQVRGLTEYVLGHKKVEKFLGIPYASPPVGKLRFEVSQVLNVIVEQPNVFKAFDQHTASFVQYIAPKNMGY